VIGYFPAAEQGTLLREAFGPETSDDASKGHIGTGGVVTWRRAVAAGSGYVDLRGLSDVEGRQDQAIAFAETWLYTPHERFIGVALGTDDGSQVFLNRRVMYENPARRGADPYEHVAKWRLPAGWNRVLFKVENGSGSFGLYFRLFDDDIVVDYAPNAIPGPVD